MQCSAHKRNQEVASDNVKEINGRILKHLKKIITNLLHPVVKTQGSRPKGVFSGGQSCFIHLAPTVSRVKIREIIPLLVEYLARPSAGYHCDFQGRDCRHS